MTLELTRPNEPMASAEADARLRLSQVSVDVKALKRSLPSEYRKMQSVEVTR